MRCPDCAKMVSFELGEPEYNDEDIADNTVSGEVRLVLLCADCGQELKEANLDFSMDIAHECGENPQSVDGWTEENEQYELIDVSGDMSERYQDTDAKGKKIKNPRYMKKFYGADIKATVRCLKCGEEFTVEDRVEEQASAFEELV